MTGKRAVLNFSAQCGNEGDDLLAGKSVRPRSFADFSIGHLLRFTKSARENRRRSADKPIGRGGVGPKVVRLGACLRKSVTDPISGQDPSGRIVQPLTEGCNTGAEFGCPSMRHDTAGGQEC